MRQTRSASRMAWAESMDFVWTYVLGPILALLPERWRRVPLWSERVRWEPAGTVSGILEMMGAVTALGYWYVYEMSRRMTEIMDLVNNGKIGPGLEEHQVGGGALALFYMSPLTWVLFYCFAEGAVRLCAAAFTGQAFGSFPLWILERATFVIRKPEQARRARLAAKEHVRSVAESVRERLMVARLEDLGDEVRFAGNGTDELLEIWASRRKEDWTPPKIVRVDEVFYRLEEHRVRKGPRPFQYRLRRLEAGVMGRGVIQYWTK